MGFFSTAQNSPMPGQAYAGRASRKIQQQNLDQNQQQFEVLQQEKIDKLMTKKLEEKRTNELSQSLLALPKISKENVTAWALANNVTAPELDLMKPILLAREEDDKTEKYSAVQIDEQGNEFQMSPKGKKEIITKAKEEEGEYGPVQTDEQGKRYQVDPHKKRVYLPETAQISGATSSKDKVADWYLKLDAHMNKKFYGDNMQPSTV